MAFTVGAALPTTFPEDAIPPTEIRRFAELAEQAGLDSLWVGEHLQWHVPTLDQFVALALAAACTSRIILGTSITLVGLHQPVWLAKRVASLSYVADRPIIVGVGVGGENPEEFAAAGVPLADRARRAEEGVEIVKALLTGRAVDADGPTFHLRQFTIQPTPPFETRFWVGGRSPAAIRRAARLGSGWLGIFMTPQRYRHCLNVLEEEVEVFRRPKGAVTPATYLFTRLGEGETDRAASYLSRQYALDWERLAPSTVVGSPAEILDRLAALRDAGCCHVTVHLIGPDPVDQLTKFRETVVERMGGWRDSAERPAGSGA